MTSYKGFKGVFGIPDQIREQTLFADTDLEDCDNHFFYNCENPGKHLRSDDNLILMFNGRIDNYKDLSDKLNMSSAHKDIELIFKAYKVFGEKLPGNILGDFSFALYDKRKQKLVLAKDQIGIKPMFYLEKEGCLFFATTIADLISLLKDKEPLNKEYIAKELLSYEQEVDDTFYKNIKRLKPAHYLAIDKKSEPSLKKYWNLSPLDLTHLKTDKEIYSLLMKTLEEAITCRIRKADKVGCQLSGGLDSSAIAVLLSRLMDKTCLHTYSFVLNEETKTFTEAGIDEKDTQQLIIDYAGLIPENHHQVEKFHYQTVYEEFESTQGLYAGAANSNCIWQESMFKQASEEDQIDVMFSGFPGDEGISYSGGMYYFDYLGNFDLKEMAGFFFDQPMNAIKKTLYYYLSFIRGTYNKRYKKNLKTRSLLHPQSRYNKTLKHYPFKFQATFKKFQKAQMLRPHTCLRAESEGLYAGKYGVETVYPLADIRILQLVYSLPARFFKPEPYKRPVMRNLCKSFLPDEVRLQPKYNGAYTLAFADYWAHFNFESLKNYQIEDRLGLFIDIEQFKKNNTEGDFKMKKGIVNLKRLDYLINRNWPESL